MFSSLYRSEYREAKTDEDKRKLAQEMLAQADSLQSDPVGRFVALEVGRKIATESGDLRLALDAAEKTIAATKEAAMGNVRSIAEDATRAIVERLIGNAPSDQAVSSAVADVLKR